MSYLIENLFSTPLYSCVVDDLENVQKEMNDAISSMPFHMKDDWGKTHYLSTNNFRDDCIEKYKMIHFKNELDKHLKNYCAEINFVCRDYKIESWFTKFEKGNYGHIHHHGYNDISGCYYVKTNENDGDIFFETPVSGATTSYAFFENYATRWWHKPKVGKLLLFPSWLSHGIATNETDNTRISFSFNIKFIL